MPATNAESNAELVGAARRLKTGTHSQRGRQVLVRRKMVDSSSDFGDGEYRGTIFVGRGRFVVSGPSLSGKDVASKPGCD